MFFTLLYVIISNTNCVIIAVLKEDNKLTFLRKRSLKNYGNFIQ